MKTRNRPHHQRRGAALLLSLFVVLAVGVISASVSSIQSTMEDQQRFSLDRRSALYIAEAGIAESVFAISQGKSGELASEEVPAAFGAGVFWVEAEDRSDGSVQLRCTGQVRSAEFVLQTNIVPNVNPITSKGFFGIEGVKIGQGTMIDGFDSSSGTYDSQVTSTTPHRTTASAGRLGSLGQVVLADSSSSSSPEASSFAWDALLGPDMKSAEEPDVRSAKDTGVGASKTLSPAAAPRVSAPITTSAKQGQDAGAALAGSATLLHADIEGFVLSSGDAILEGVVELDGPGFIPPPTLRPATAGSLPGDLVVTGAQVGTGGSSSLEIEGDLVIQSGASLRLDGPLVLALETLRMETGAELQLDDSAGPIQLYLQAGFECATSSRLTSLAPEPEAQGTSIFVEPPPEPRDALSLPGMGRFHGALYAPGDEVIVPKALRWLGAITARHLETEPGARLSYDASLAIGGLATPNTPQITAWQIIPVGDGLARRLPIDPKVALRLRGVTPVPSPEAAPESECEVVMLDSSGSPTTFTGPVSALTASPKRILNMRWVDGRNGTLRRWLRPAGADTDGSIPAYREKVKDVRVSVVGLAGPAGPASKAELAKLAASLPVDDLIKPITVSALAPKGSSAPAGQ
ncbi:MAG: hypothetical protein P8R46_10415 [Planctomycetota bacterium]|nr:hypothetical protein [Planctomycetota bacterium]